MQLVAMKREGQISKLVTDIEMQKVYPTLSKLTPEGIFSDVVVQQYILKMFAICCNAKIYLLSVFSQYVMIFLQLL